MKTYRTVTMVLLLTVAACGKQHGGVAPSSESGSDTIAVASIPEDNGVRELPDTVYPSAEGIKFEVIVTDSTIEPQVNDLRDLYSNTPGSFTFRKDAFRDADFGSVIDSMPTSMEVVWRYRTRCSRTWGGGSGWTGQPVYVEWPDSCLVRFARKGLLLPGFSGKEIIVGGLSGDIYFIDFESGKDSRPPIRGYNPIKGSVSLDPSLNGNLYVGQGIPDTIPFGAALVDLYQHRTVEVFPFDKSAPRRWGAYDSSAARAGQFLFRPGENGVLYKFFVEPAQLKLQSKMSYRINGKAPGMESSIAIYSNYGYVADNSGNLLCVNLNTLRPVWLYRTGDDTDHTPVLAVESGQPYIYIGCEVDKQPEDSGTARFAKIDAFDGREVWHTDIGARMAVVGEKHFDGGYYATSLLGRGDCEGLIFASCVLNTDDQNGILVAFDRATGRKVYTVPLARYGWSSPVGMLTRDGRQIVVVADCTGNIYLISGKDGKVICRKSVGANFESSPVVVGDCLVVGSRGDTIFKIRII